MIRTVGRREVLWSALWREILFCLAKSSVTRASNGQGNTLIFKFAPKKSSMIDD